MKTLKELSEDTKKGRLTSENFESRKQTLMKWLEVEQIRGNFVKPKVIKSVLDQTVESALVRNLRDLYIGKLRFLGMKVYWQENREIIEDPMWYLTREELSEGIKTLKRNRYPKHSWESYLLRSIRTLKTLKGAQKGF